MRILKVEVTGPDGGQVRSGEEVNIRIVAESDEAMFGAFHLGISQGTAMPVFVLRYASSFPEGQFELRCKMQSLPLPKGRYSLWGAMRAPRGSGHNAQLPWQPITSFEAFGPGGHPGAERCHGALPRVRAGGMGAELNGAAAPSFDGVTRRRGHPPASPAGGGHGAITCSRWRASLPTR